ncbi:MAG: RNA pyrophosphohydrolase [Chitinophagales bacterium]|nr:RNA pyrophosphohydrolase [Chitinophagales bacterium]
MHKDKFFRANVGVIIINSKGQVLAFERTEHENSWQFPQGGIDRKESPKTSIEREIHEETGIKPNSELKYLDEYKDWIAYELPKKMRKKWIGRGQVQKWFLYKVMNDDIELDLENIPNNEFSKWCWIDMEELVEIVIPFRKPTYIKLLKWLKERKTATNNG